MVEVSVGRAYGAQSMTAPLRDVLVKRPGPAFGRAFDDPAHGFLHPVDLDVARREHDAFVEVLARLGPTVHELGRRDRQPGPRLPVRSAPRDRRGARSRSARASRTARPRSAVVEPGRRSAASRRSAGSRRPARSTGGDTFWLRPDLLCIGRTLRTNAIGARQLAALVGGDVRVFDLPYWRRPGRAGPPPVGHLAGRRRPRRRLPAAPAGRAVGAARRPRRAHDRTSRTRSSRRSAATSSRSGRGS